MARHDLRPHIDEGLPPIRSAQAQTPLGSKSQELATRRGERAERARDDRVGHYWVDQVAALRASFVVVLHSLDLSLTRRRKQLRLALDTSSSNSQRAASRHDRLVQQLAFQRGLRIGWDPCTWASSRPEGGSPPVARSSSCALISLCAGIRDMRSRGADPRSDHAPHSFLVDQNRPRSHRREGQTSILDQDVIVFLPLRLEDNVGTRLTGIFEKSPDVKGDGTHPQRDAKAAAVGHR